MNASYEFISLTGLFVVLGSIIFWVIRYNRLTKSAELRTSLVKDKMGRQEYIHESHILMAGLGASTECINCGGTSQSEVSLRKLIIPCSMELSVYDGNNKFKHSTGETNV